MAMKIRKTSFPEFQELVKIIENRDELRYSIAVHELFEAVQNSSMKDEKKLVVYDYITKMSNCHETERVKFLKKISRRLK